MDLNGNLSLRRYSAVVVVCTFLLVIAGALVTSNDAALAIPDWPLSYGKLVPPLEGGIRFEFAHRTLGLLVAVLIGVLAFWSRRRVAWLAFGAVLAQIALGVAAVKLVDPKAIAVAHASLAQLCFGLVVAVYVGGGVGRSLTAMACPTALFGQTILGAMVRHSVIGLIPHIVGAVVATLVVMWVGLQVMSRHMEEPPLRRWAMLLLSFTFSQVFLGMGAWMAGMANADFPQPMPMMVWFTTAHVAVGALAFGSAVALGILLNSRTNADSEVHVPGEGMVAA